MSEGSRGISGPKVCMSQPCDATVKMGNAILGCIHKNVKIKEIISLLWFDHTRNSVYGSGHHSLRIL